jgi:hypothetical protein
VSRYGGVRSGGCAALVHAVQGRPARHGDVQSAARRTSLRLRLSAACRPPDVEVVACLRGVGGSCAGCAPTRPRRPRRGGPAAKGLSSACLLSESGYGQHRRAHPNLSPRGSSFRCTTVCDRGELSPTGVRSGPGFAGIPEYRRVVRRDARGRYQAPLTAGELLGAVRQVALAARPAEPTLCSQSQFDAAREQAGWSALPSAVTIARRLKSSWPALLGAIFDPARDEHRFVALRDSDSLPTALTLDDAVAAIRYTAAACGIGEGNEFSHSQHDAIMVPLREYARRRRDRAQAHWLFPTVQMIDSTVGWQAALQAAGLRPRQTTSVPGLPLIDALELFLHDHGFLAGERSIKRWARERGLSIANGNFREARAALMARRAREGRWTPPGLLPSRRRPRTTAGGGPRNAREQSIDRLPRRRRIWTADQVKVGLMMAADRARR